jgi:hypothetical protein
MAATLGPNDFLANRAIDISLETYGSKPAENLVLLFDSIYTPGDPTHLKAIVGLPASPNCFLLKMLDPIRLSAAAGRLQGSDQGRQDWFFDTSFPHRVVNW